MNDKLEVGKVPVTRLSQFNLKGIYNTDVADINCKRNITCKITTKRQEMCWT